MIEKDKNISLIIFMMVFVLCFFSWFHREKDNKLPDCSLSLSVISTSAAPNDRAIVNTSPVIPDIQLFLKSHRSVTYCIPDCLSGRELNTESLFSCCLTLFLRASYNIPPVKCISFHKKIPPGNRNEDVIPLV